MPPKKENDDGGRADKIAKKKRELMTLAIKHKNERNNERKRKNDRKVPVSGSEMEFTDLVWGSPKGIDGNNCYGFAADEYRDGGFDKLQPGEIAGTLKTEDDLTTCDVLGKRVLDDLRIRGGYRADPDAPCAVGHYKIMSFVAPGKDYHWYRQTGDMLVRVDGKNTVASIAKNAGVPMKNVNIPTGENSKNRLALLHGAGLWAHKRGLDELSTKDASGKFIKDPRNANRTYPPYDYKDFCNAYCLPVRR